MNDLKQGLTPKAKAWLIIISLLILSVSLLLVYSFGRLAAML